VYPSARADETRNCPQSSSCRTADTPPDEKLHFRVAFPDVPGHTSSNCEEFGEGCAKPLVVSLDESYVGSPLKQPGAIVAGPQSEASQMRSAPCFAVQVDNGVDGPVVRVRGELDMATCPQLRERLLELTDQVVTLDFAAVTFMDSSGTGVLLEAQKRIREDGGKLVLYGLGPQLRRVLEISGLGDYFDSLVAD
jgi:anti-sigma B factor antagonist